MKPYKCDYCEKSFTQRCSLESHQDKIHGLKHKLAYKQRREKIYVCEECGYSTGDVRLVCLKNLKNFFSDFKNNKTILIKINIKKSQKIQNKSKKFKKKSKIFEEKVKKIQKKV